jgi:DNA-directed RNA polymerase III subunit RPC7
MTHDPTAPRKMYGQDQTNAQYGVRNRALQDPFTSMPTYAQRFVREERSLPDWTRRPVNRELFPDELLEVIDPEGSRKRRKLELTRVNALPNAEEAFGMANNDYEEEDPFAAEDATGEDGQPQPGSRKSLLDRIDALDGEEGDENTELRDDDEPEEQEPQDEEYDDEDAGDYDAENYFDNGDDIGDDYGDDGEGEGTY